MKRRQAGFSFIEILVVMGIISVLVSMVVVVIPNILEKQRQTKSQDNVKSLLTMMLSRQIERGWPHYSGKNFVLSVVADGLIDIRNPQNLEILFSPGDENYSFKAVSVDRYKEIDKSRLKSGQDFHELTSYAGRRNADKDYLITPDQMSQNTIVICDDDDGPLHHPKGIMSGYSNGNVRFMEWEELDMRKPEDPDHPEPFLGDQASNDTLRKLSSQ